MQVLPSNGRQLTFVAVARDLLQREGWRALGSGLAARVLTIGPGAALSWMLYEEIKGLLVVQQ